MANIISGTNHEPHLIEYNDVNSVEYWDADAVTKEVSRGNRLREAKPINRYTEPREGINMSMPEFKGVHRIKKKPPTNRNIRSKTPSCSPKCDFPYNAKRLPSRTYPMSTNNIPIPNTDKRNQPRAKCAMRIAELAVPTKRHCIETWRNKGNILPYFMIDRLRQQVSEPRPLIQVPEAIDSFKRCKQPRKKAPDVKGNKISVDKTLKLDTKNFCSRFSYKVAKRLGRPVNAVLSPTLENLSNIIFEELTKLLKIKKMSLENIRDGVIQRDVARKISIWIVGVLEDLKFKLLEEDLRAKKKKEGLAARTGKLVTLIEKLLAKENRAKFKELEEEEGPVLDFMDDLVDNVLDIVEPIPDNKSDKSSFSLTYENESHENLILNKLSASCDAITSLLTNVISSIEDKYLKEANEIERNNIRNKMYDLVESILTSKEFLDEKKSRNILDLDNIKDIHPPTDNEAKNIVSEYWAKNENVNSEHKQQDNTNEANEDSDDGSKAKVKFFDKRMVKEYDGTVTETLSINTENSQDIEDIGIRSPPPSTTDIKFNKTFSEPNLHLLSQADEIWPLEISNLKPSFSASRSILSLGKILELSETNNVVDKTVATPGASSNYITYNSEKLKETIIPALETEIDSASSSFIRHKTKDFIDDEYFKPTSGDGVALEAIDQSNKASNEYIMKNKDAPSPADTKYRDGYLEDLYDPIQKEYYSSTNVMEPKNLLEDDPYTDKTNTNSISNFVNDYASKKNIAVGEIPRSEDITKRCKNYLSSTCITKYESKESLSDDYYDAKNIERITGQLPDLLIEILSKEISADHILPTERKGKPHKIMKQNNSNKISHDDQQKAQRKPSYSTNRKIIYEWKVEPMAAPSWVSHARGDSEDSLPDRSTFTLTMTDIRKWAHDLEKGFDNLELWNDWLKSTRLEIMGLRKKKSECLCDAMKQKKVCNLIQLKKNVDKDAMLWRKLYQRTQIRFQVFKYIESVSAERPHCNCKNNNKQIMPPRDIKQQRVPVPMQRFRR